MSCFEVEGGDIQKGCFVCAGMFVQHSLLFCRRAEVATRFDFDEKCAVLCIHTERFSTDVCPQPKDAPCCVHVPSFKESF